MPQINISNKSKRISDDQVAIIAEAVNIQMNGHVVPTWGIDPIDVVFQSGDPNAWKVTLVDYSQQIMRLKKPSAIVVCHQGCEALTGAYALSTMVSHECVELAVDPWVSQWSVCGVNRDGSATCVARDIANPVDNQFYGVMVDGQLVNVSSFVTPDWFNLSTTTQRTDILDTLGGKPLVIAAGGYIVTWGSSGQKQTSGINLPQWRLKQKRVWGSRGFMRMVNHSFRIV